MKIGYPCINTTLQCRGTRTFRLKSFSEERFIETVRQNLACLGEILRFNARHGILFFRISSDLIPFASHPVCTIEWQDIFRDEFWALGQFIRKHSMRISMHPDQFIVINSPDTGVVERGILELQYHAGVLDIMQLDETAKIQLHVGGVYGDRTLAMNRFVERYKLLPESVRRRLVIENDDRSYSLQDCLIINRMCGIPVIFDNFHHELNGDGEPVESALRHAASTWHRTDGIPMVDYSTQQPGARQGRHAASIDVVQFSRFLRKTTGIDFDVMLEIKDKEASALKAIQAARTDPRFIRDRDHP